ncbi:carboxymuconolactone decarboxylase family protein [Natronobeatus ordinarius]|uniref:carboxymuconolactone decarboxylase family protein n=1 Tax=Natronobeatus ordinarius TaxID=2963433 RepID=UPI0020CBF51E|nr:carboxymuconolactone decarboxylase family protein [Natronobeatus ordinarius]
MVRVPYVDPDDLPAEKRALLDTLSETEEAERAHELEGGTLNVYRLLGNNVAVLEAFRSYGSTVWQESGLTPHERETVILATSCHADAPYEWHQHVRVALDEGMTREQIRAISSGDHEALEPELAAAVDYVDAFVEGDVDDDVHDRLADHFDDDVIVGIGALAGLYLGLARALDAFAVDTEVEFVGWDLENL